MTINLEQEKDRLDFITDAMISLDFLDCFSTSIFDEAKNKYSIKEFYTAWIESFKDGSVRIPMSLGIIVGYMYCGILFAKENWFDLLPDVEVEKADEKFGFTGIEYVYPEKSNPKLSDIVRRMRNALGHGNIDVFVPEDIEFENRYKETLFIFKDKNMNKPEDIFEIKMPVSRIYMFVREFQGIICEYVKRKA